MTAKLVRLVHGGRRRCGCGLDHRVMWAGGVPDPMPWEGCPRRLDIPCASGGPLDCPR
jgi:hypothetical protein